MAVPTCFEWIFFQVLVCVSYKRLKPPDEDNNKPSTSVEAPTERTPLLASGEITTVNA